MIEEKDSTSLKRMFVRDGRLTGYIMIGNVSRAGIYTALIRNKTPLDEINFDVMKLSPTLFAYSEKSRRKMLGGVV